MDRYLQRLKRLSHDSPQAQERYIAALERALGGATEEEHPNFRDARIATCWIKDIEQERTILRNIRDVLMPYEITDINGEHHGVLVDVYWEDAWSTEDEIEEVRSHLSPATIALLDDAAEQGYTMLVFWR